VSRGLQFPLNDLNFFPINLLVFSFSPESIINLVQQLTTIEILFPVLRSEEEVRNDATSLNRVQCMSTV
jgi:hypothetical protein